MALVLPYDLPLFMKKPDSVLTDKNGDQLAMFTSLPSKQIYNISTGTSIILQHSSKHLVLV